MPRSVSSSTDYDAIVIGSGIGGLTAASLLSQLDKRRVLLLERHFKLGGFTQTFRRAGFTFDPGLHYVGDMQPGGQMRQFMDLVTRSRVDWFRMPSPFDVFVYPGLRLEQPDDPVEFRAQLTTRFPQQADAIATYFIDLERANTWFTRHLALQLLPGPARALAQLLPGRSLALQTTRAYLDVHFADPRLKALLVSQWGDYGLPPSTSAFGMHALVVQSYMHGAWYPIGGAGQIGEQVAELVRSAGGDVLLNHEVSEIVIEHGKARGVRARRRHGQQLTDVSFRAPLVISDAGAEATFRRLVPAGLAAREHAAIANLPQPGSMVALYLGLNDHPSRIGLQGENYWLYRGYDHDMAYANGSDLADGHVSGCYVSFPSTRDPHATRHTAQLITWVPAQVFAAWREQAWHQRDAAYAALKERISQALIDFVDERLPGLRDLIAYQELATPLSFEHFTGHADGAVYGLPATPERFKGPAFGPHTSIPGLLLTGCDVGSLGIIGSMMGGVMATAAALGPLGFPRILASAAKRASPSSVETAPERHHLLAIACRTTTGI